MILSPTQHSPDMALTQKKIEKGLKLFESLGIFSIIFSFQEKELVLVALSQEMT